VRIWNGPHPQPRLGMVGVLPDYRRLGLARALIGQAFAALHVKGVVKVIAEADAEDTASNTLLTGLGGVVTGRDIEMRRAGAGTGGVTRYPTGGTLA
jgi:ribosomal protein S18 acetylase RimI-like enzyme